MRVIAFTTRYKKNLPTHVYYQAGEGGLPKDSILLAECMWDINKFQIIKTVGRFDEVQMKRAANAIKVMMPLVS